MRLNILAAVALLTLGFSQQACGREPAAPRLPDRDDSRSVPVQRLAATSSADCQEPATALDTAISRTIAAVQAGDPKAFLELVSEDGLSFGPDSGPVGFRELQTRFDGKSGPFCALFGCAGKPASLGPKFKRGAIDKQIDLPHGLATVFLNANTNDELDLNYRLRGCRWELTGIAAVE
ncbi:MAG: hypothetical protein JF615_06240 [Asticcacaulis sp.]|nr:hypothetical protein [Asticcacaulis sp.]